MVPNWDKVSFVVASTYRTAVLQRLMRGPATQSGIAADAEIASSHVSRALTELREHGLIELLVAEDRRRVASTASPNKEQLSGRLSTLNNSSEPTWQPEACHHCARS